MLKRILFSNGLFFITLICAYKLYAFNNNKALSYEAQKSLISLNFRYLGICEPKMKIPDTLAHCNNIKKIAVSRFFKKLTLKTKTELTRTNKSKFSQNLIDILLTEDFESRFPGSKWQLSGKPTWDKGIWENSVRATNSCWCVGSARKNWGIDKYEPDMDAKMISGPYDLSESNLACLSFKYKARTEENHDWFYWLASTDGKNFSGYAVSGGTSLVWEYEVFDLTQVPELGNLTNNDSVWIAFGFTSDSNSVSSYDEGAYVDDIVFWRGNGTALSGYVSGKLEKQGNPYFAISDIGIKSGESLEIEPGVQIRFERDYQFLVEGELQAIGTESDSIVFTSNAPIPSMGDWRGLVFYDQDFSTRRTIKNILLEYCIIEYTGAYDINTYYGGIWCMGNSFFVKILNCGFYDNSQYAVSSTISTEDDSLIIIGNKFINNHFGIYGYSSEIVAINNIFYNTERDSQNKFGSGVGAAFTDLFAEGNIIYNCSSGIYATDSEVIIRSNMIKSNEGDGINILYGASGIYGDFSCIIENNIIKENGKQSNAGIEIEAGSYLSDDGIITIRNNIISNNNIGIHFEEPYHAKLDVDITFHNNAIVDNNEYGIMLSGSTDHIMIMNNIISHNGDYGIYFEKSGIKNIEYNNLYRNGNRTKSFGGIDVAELGTITKENANGNDCDNFFNIISNPYLMDSQNSDYRLQTRSPCIDAGNPDIKYNDAEDPNNPGSALMPAMGSVNNDIGAYGGPHIVNYNIVSVWPGDNNNNGFVDASDILPVGKFWHQRGFARTDTTTNWNPYKILNHWDIKEAVFADGNGDGIINEYDVLPIARNWHMDSTSIVSDNNLNKKKIYIEMYEAVHSFQNDEASKKIKNLLLNIIENSIIIPTAAVLHQNFPNPFNSQTHIQYSIHTNNNMNTTLKIYNFKGELVKTLVDKKQSSGNYNIQWDGKTENGKEAASGIYFYKLNIGRTVHSCRKLILLK